MVLERAVLVDPERHGGQAGLDKVSLHGGIGENEALIHGLHLSLGRLEWLALLDPEILQEVHHDLVLRTDRVVLNVVVQVLKIGL